MPGGERHELETDHPLQSSAEVKNGGAMLPLLQMPSWLAAQVKHRNKFTIKLMKKMSRFLKRQFRARQFS
jgi:hypothetical protein